MDGHPMPSGIDRIPLIDRLAVTQSSDLVVARRDARLSPHCAHIARYATMNPDPPWRAIQLDVSPHRRSHRALRMPNRAPRTL